MTRGAQRGRRAGGPRRPRAGFSLLEVMIALGLLAFGVLGVTAAQIAAAGASRQSRDQGQAMYLAQQQIESFLGMPGSAVTAFVTAPGYPNDPGNPIDPDPGDGDPTTYQRSWNIQPDTPEAGMITVTVSVAWVDEQGNARLAQLSSLKADL